MSEKNKGGAMPEENELEVSVEEKEADEQGLTEVKTEELREKIAEDLGIDSEMEGDLLNKLVERETEQHKKLSKTIKQKIGWRDKAKKTSKKPDEKKPDGKKPKEEKPATAAMVTEEVNKVLAERDLKALALPEDIETEVQDLAKVKGISIGEAAKLPYILSRVEAVEKEERIKAGTPSRSNKGKFKTSIDPSQPLNPEDFDLSTKEGQKSWKEARVARTKHRNQ